MSGPIELRCGRWQDVLQDVGMVDAVITDPPFSPRTHDGRRTGSDIRQANIPYDPLDESACSSIAAQWAPRVRWWAVLFCDHVARQWHAAAWEREGFYVFGPVRWVKPDAPPRMSGDGPTVASEDILVARRSVRLGRGRTGSRVGYYECPTAASRLPGVGHPGAKPVTLMRALTRDYTLPGDLVVDPFAGTGTTLIAAAMEGRRAIGAEMDPSTYEKAQRRIAAGYTLPLFAGAANG